HRVLNVDVIGDHGRPDVGEGHAHVLGLAAVVTARGMRIAVEGAHRAGLGIGVVAVAVEFLLAEIAAAAEGVERHQHAVADLEVLHRRTDLLHHAGELVAHDLPDPRVRHQAVVDVDVGAADARAGDAHDRGVGMFDLRLGDALDAHPARATVRGCQHAGSPGGAAGIGRQDSDLGAGPVNT